MEIVNVERAFTPQLYRPMMVMPWQPKCAFHLQQEKAFFRHGDLGNAAAMTCFGWKVGQQRSSGLSLSKYFSRVQEAEIPLNLLHFPCEMGKSMTIGAKRRGWTCSVFNEVMGQRSEVPPGPAATSPDDLKNQLEALQDESLQVRNRFNSAKARFMRLTEVAQQLRQRAAIDLNVGNEDGARNALVEKQKVIQAAELSKKRAQLLEELSIKLGEAISVKETQLIVALSKPHREEPTVRVVTPAGQPFSSANLDLNGEENPSGLRTVEASQNDEEFIPSQDPAGAAEDMNGDNSQVVADTGDVLIERERASLATELGYSTDRYDNEVDVEGTSPKSDSNILNLRLRGEEFDIDILTSDSNRNGGSGESHNGIQELEIVGQDVSLDEGEATTEATFHGGLVEHLILDVDGQVAGIESKLRTAVSRNIDTTDIDLRLVEDLLEQIQNLRARISEIVGSVRQQETQ